MIALRNLLIATALVLPVTTWADDSHHPDTKTPATTKATAPADLESHMQKMQAMLDKLKAAKTPAERQKLMQEHRKLMQEGMTMMKNMDTDCPGMKEGKDGDMGMGKGKAGGMGDGKGGGMDMMQQMMDHMMKMEDMMMQK